MKEEMNLSEKEKEVYVKPSVEVIEMEMEGILCQSGPSQSPNRGDRSW